MLWRALFAIAISLSVSISADLTDIIGTACGAVRDGARYTLRSISAGLLRIATSEALERISSFRARRASVYATIGRIAAGGAYAFPGAFLNSGKVGSTAVSFSDACSCRRSAFLLQVDFVPSGFTLSALRRACLRAFGTIGICTLRATGVPEEALHARFACSSPR